MISLNAKTHSSREMTESCFENADDKGVCYFKQRVTSMLSLSSECVKMKLCKPCTSFTSHPHCLCGMMWYRTLRVNMKFSILPQPVGVLKVMLKCTLCIQGGNLT